MKKKKEIELDEDDLMRKCTKKVEDVSQLIEQFGAEAVLSARDKSGRSCLFRYDDDC